MTGIVIKGTGVKGQSVQGTEVQDTGERGKDYTQKLSYMYEEQLHGRFAWNN